jgi:hypothetical protein
MSWDTGRRQVTRAPVLLAAFLLSVASLTAGVVVTFAEPAHAESLGGVTLTPQQAGTVTENPMFTTGRTAACPPTFGENANLRIGRPGGPYSNLAPALGGGGYDIHEITINPTRSFQTAIGGTAPEQGVWWVVMECYSLTDGRHPDEFRTPIVVCGSTWKAGASCSDAVSTTTTLTVEPNTPSVPVGTAVTLTAHVTPTDAAGDVVFRRKTPVGNTQETVPLGGPMPLANGTAAMTLSDLPGPQGAPSVRHELTAEFVPDNQDHFLGSTSPAQPLSVVPAGGAATTEVALNVEPDSPQPVNAALTLTATVTPPTAAGKVLFARQGAAGSAAIPLGEPVDLTGGSATKSTGPMPQGIWSLIATFQPTDPTAFQTSSKTIPDFQIGDAVATPTTTQLAVSPPNSPQLQGTPLTLTATVQPTNAAGSVKFFDGATQIGDTQTVSGGAATVATSSLAVGTHPLRAAFTPADPATFAASESTVTQFVISAPPDGGDDLTVLDATGNELGANPSLHRRDTVTVIGRGFSGTESVSVKLDGTELTTVTASDGVAQYEFTVASDAAEGAHQLLLDGASHQVAFDFTVAAGDGGDGGGGGGSLPTTGLPLIGIGLLGVALVGLGSAARLAARRREQPAPVAWPGAVPRSE